MIDRAEIGGVAASVAGHVALFGLLSLGFIAVATPVTIESTPIEVTLADDVALVSGAPDPSTEAPAARKSPVEAPVEPDTAPEPVVEPAPPAKPQPAPPKSAIPDPSARQRPDKQTPPPAAATRPGTRKLQPTGRLDGLDLNAPSDRASTSTSTKVQASTMSTQAAQNIASAITRQIQPCADRQVNPGPGANRIIVTIQLHLNRDGSLVDRPTVVGEPVSDASNGRYVARVKDLAIAAFVGCAPLRGLPADLWDVPRGWRNFKMRYKLPD